ncbi:MAG TPA: SDR family NAD(P)-dependent oxidoreductase [Verrucomicrobiae bacterium]|nr:SDR family NAD(P)-dependent oxidoreductase [Verrucomicrobiae bacterium]
MEIAGKVAVVTGGASGIGRGIGRALAARGADVVVADVDAARAAEVAAELARAGVRSIGAACDVTERASVETLADSAWTAFGHVDVLCNNAGVGTLAPVTDTPLRDAEWLFAVNVWGVIHGCQVFVPRFLAAGRPAHVLNTGSEHSVGIPFPGMGIYTATKHAVLALSDVLRRELESQAVGVSILCPGVVRTEIWNAGRSRPERFGGRQESPPEFATFLDSGMDPDEVGRIAVAGIEAGDFFIMSHPEVRAVAEARCRDVLAAFELADRRIPPRR